MILLSHQTISIILEHKSSLRSQISSEKTTTNKKGFLRLSKSINPTTSSPLLNDAIKEQMVLYTKLFLIMGLSWIFEILEPIILRSTSDENCSALVRLLTFLTKIIEQHLN